ncbi:MAG TPA: transcriptional regulator [Phycisphaerales bacterium]|nr:transcriptional regulator [Phycisphaerales bacterium]
MPRKARLVPMESLREAAECLKVMAHPVRLRIVDILMQGRYPVRRIAEMCDLPAHQTSEHLRLLKGCRLLDCERDGRTVYYRLATPRLPALLTCIRKTCGH